MPETIPNKPSNRPAQLTQALYSVDQSRQIDQLTIKAGTPGFDLMMQAGEAAFSYLQRHWSEVETIWCVCGAGNNGGDGSVVAGLAHQQGLTVHWILLVTPDQLTGEALEAYEWARLNGVEPAYELPEEIESGLIVDGLLGTGINKEVSGTYQKAIELINRSSRQVLSLDVPSGIQGDTGNRLGVAVKADRTISFIVNKVGLFTAESLDHCGEVDLAPLRIPKNIRNQFLPKAELVGFESFRDVIQQARKRNSHKGLYGHVAIILGEMIGASCLAAEAAARTGAGWVSAMGISSLSGNHFVQTLLTRMPQLMVKDMIETLPEPNISQNPTNNQSMMQLFDRTTSLVLGQGLGQSNEAETMFNLLIDHPLPMVVDADGLNFLSGYFNKHGELPYRRDRVRVLTPHPGEAARLLDVDASEIQKDRIGAVTNIANQYQAVVVLKGAGTLIAQPVMNKPDSEQINQVSSELEQSPPKLLKGGNPGMSVAGMGDLLAGIIGTLLGQHPTDGYTAACLGVAIHNQAADLAARNGEKGMLPQDVIDKIRQVIN